MDTVSAPIAAVLAQLGQDLSLARRRRHLSQADLAARMGTSVSTVRRMESGHAGTALHHLARALQVFGELDKLAHLLDTARDDLGLALMDEKLPQRVRSARKTATRSF